MNSPKCKVGTKVFLNQKHDYVKANFSQRLNDVFIVTRVAAQDPESCDVWYLYTGYFKSDKYDFTFYEAELSFKDKGKFISNNPKNSPHME